MTKINKYAAVAIPLNRPSVVDFLIPPTTSPKGAPLHVVGHRPTEAAYNQWAAHLVQMSNPTIHDYLKIDQPRHHITPTHTDRLVPVEFLAEPGFLTRNLGGWSPVYFGVVGLPEDPPADPLLNYLEILTDYGQHIHTFGADPDQVETRLVRELQADFATTVNAIGRLHAMRQPITGPSERSDYIDKIYASLAGPTWLDAPDRPPIPRLLLYDELLGQLVELELTRRALVAAGKRIGAHQIEARQQQWLDETGLYLILKGEYIAGRHRASMILIAPELKVVIKQPAPEPFHEIELGAQTVEGRPENWPRTTGDGALVTPRGRLRLTVEENIIPRLSRALEHRIQHSTVFGITVEDYVAGPTVQDMVLANPHKLTPDLYEVFVLHQQVCEAVGGENGDWHAANFVVRQRDGKIVHIDWGAARPLRDEEHTPAGELTRLNQVKNLAYSFHDDALAKKTLQLHAAFMANPDRLSRIRQKARRLVNRLDF